MDCINASEQNKFIITDTSFNLNSYQNDSEKVQDFNKKLKRYLIENDGNSINDMSQIIPESRPYDRTQYLSIVLNARSAKPLCEKFDKDPSGLIKSDASETSFALAKILERMSVGHKIYKYNYNRPTRKVVTVRIHNDRIEILTSEHRKSVISFQGAYGIVLGASSSTFRMYKSEIDFQYGPLHNPEDCFSIVCECRTYDFATSSSTQRYDICLSLSWLCSLNNSLQSCIPFTKCTLYIDFLSFRTAIDKLRREAAARFLSINELFIVILRQLAIYKTLNQLNSSHPGLSKIITILSKRFILSSKLYRFTKYILMPMILSENYKKTEFSDKIRVNLLVSNKIKLLSQIINKDEQIHDKLEAKMKRTVMDSMVVPSCKSIFKKNSSFDPFLSFIRSKVNK